jgi:membrane protease YdiL (CAAX protease family)
MDINNEQAKAHPQTWLGILGVVIALSTPIVQFLLSPVFKLFAFPIDRFLSLLPFWISIVLVLGIAHYAEGYPLALFGFARTQKTLRTRLIEWIITIVAAFVTGVVMITFSTYVRTLLTNQPMPNATLLLKNFPAWVLFFAWLTGAFTEEVLFRSYAIERLTLLIGNRWLAALITSFTFAILHIFGWDWIHVLTAVLPGSIMLTLFYLWKRSLALNVIIHAVLNAPLLLVPMLAAFI